MAAAPETRDDVLRLLAELAPVVRTLGVHRLALFGSFARGEGRAGSDVDLLVEFAAGQKTFDNFVALASLLEAALQRRVELVTIEALSPYIGPRILAEAEDVLPGT